MHYNNAVMKVFVFEFWDNLKVLQKADDKITPDYLKKIVLFKL